jgi:hypothetical protein
MRDSLSFQFKLYYPTPGHLEEIAQLSIPNYFCSVAEINVVTTAVASQIKDVVEYLPTFHVVAPQLVINPHKPSFNIFYKGNFFLNKLLWIKENKELEYTRVSDWDRPECVRKGFQIFAIKFRLGEVAAVKGIADNVLMRTSAISCRAAS